MNIIRKIFNALKRPSLPVLLVAYIFTAASITGAMLTLFVKSSAILEKLSYMLYTFSMLGLTYTVYTIVIFAPKWKESIIDKLNSRAFTRKLIENHGYRTIIISTVTFLIGLIYSVFLIILCIFNRSVWYGVLAGFHMLISFARMFVVFGRKSNTKGMENEKSIEISYAKTHRNCGILLIVSTMALNVAVLQMVFLQRSFSYAGNIIYVAAMYSFYKITISIINLIKKENRQDLNLAAVKNINFTDAMVSILALQTALLSTFGGKDMSFIFNAITGGVVCALTLAIGIAMVITGATSLKKIKMENKISGK